MSRPPPVLPPRIPKALLLVVLPLPLLAELLGSLVKGELLDTLGAGAALAGFFAAAVLLRRGLVREAELAARRYVLRRPPPLKLLGALLAGAATALVSALLVEAHALWESLAFGATAVVGTLLLYGLDPGVRFSEGDLDAARRQEILAALGEAEEKLLAIEQARGRIFNEELAGRLERVVAEARDILEILARRPEQMRQARRFLHSYLDGARQVAKGYAETHRRAQSAELEDKFRTVLETIDGAFREQKERLLADDMRDLDVNIEVLRMQLEREGI